MHVRVPAPRPDAPTSYRCLAASQLPAQQHHSAWLKQDLRARHGRQRFRHGAEAVFVIWTRVVDWYVHMDDDDAQGQTGIEA